MINKTIFVVDDEPTIRELFKKGFSNAGYDVVTAESAEETLEIVKETPFWVFFLDLNLPGMNGVELGKRLHDEYPMAVLIAVTGFASLFDLTECRAAGFDDYFIKPANLKDLVKAADYAFWKLDRWRNR